MSRDDAFDNPDAEFLERYRETCRRLGVEPVSAERAARLVAEWNDLLLDANGGKPPRLH